jgi:tol-pal system protein YbgF
VAGRIARAVPAIPAAVALCLTGCAAGTFGGRSAEIDAERRRQEEIRQGIQEIKRLQEEEAKRRIDREAEILLTLEDLEGRLERLDYQLRDLLDGLSRAPVRPSPSGSTSGETSLEDPRSAYEAAYLEVTRGHYDLAADAFEEFIRKFPASDLTDNATYWIGECRYAQRDFNRAVEAFVRLIDTYPSADKVPAAMLKLGYTFAEMGDTAAARRYLQGLVDQFPGTDEAAKARERLASF